MISAYSVCSSVIIFNLLLALVFILRRRTRFLAQHTVALLLFISALGLVRLFTPIDFEGAVVIQSWHLLPALQSAVHAKLPILGVSVGTTMLALWACGSLVFAVRDISAACSAQCTRREYTYLENEHVKALAAQLGLNDRCKVSPQIQSPYVAGIFRPMIYLPTMELTEDEMLFVLRHEAEHIRSGDGLKKLLLLIIKWLFWFNPFAHISMAEADKLLELRCDERVARALDDREKLCYAEAMMTVIRQLAPGQADSDLCTVHFVGDEPSVRQRFELLLTDERRRPRTTAALYAAAVLVFVLSYFVVIQPASMPPQIEGEVLELTKDNSYIVHSGEKYFVYYFEDVWDVLSIEDLETPPYNELEIIEEVIP